MSKQKINELNRKINQIQIKIENCINEREKEHLEKEYNKYIHELCDEYIKMK